MAKERTDLKNEAVKINGSYIEDVLQGYTTLKTSGREVLTKELSIRELPCDGSAIEQVRYPMREIEVEYLLTATDQNDFVEKYSKLMELLSVEDAQIIFNNEPDKYLTGTIVAEKDIDRCFRARSGKFTINCADPFKYSVTEVSVNTSEVTIEGETLTVLDTTNNGTYRTYPRFEIQFKEDSSSSGEVGTDADCGYVIFAKGGTDYSLQIGDDEEKDITTETVVNQDFTKSSKGSFADANSLPVLSSSHVYNGSTKASTSGLQINSTTAVSKKYHGPCCVFTLPTAATGAFTFQFKHVLNCHKTASTGKKQGGAFWVALLGTNNEVIWAHGIHKSNTTKLTGSLYNRFEGESNSLEDSACDLSYTGLAGFKKKTSTTPRLSTCELKRSASPDGDGLWNYEINTNWEEGSSWNHSGCPAVKKIVFFFGKYGSNAGFSNNRVTWAKFVDGDYDQLNSFHSGDKVDIDVSDMSILLNSKNAADIGDISNDWSNMCLDVGNNQILCQWSDWVQEGYEPEIKMYYRKRYL